MSSVSAPSPAAPVAAESQAGPALQLAQAGGRGRPWLRFPGPAPRLWLCDAVALTLAYALGTIVTTGGAAANPLWPLCFGLIVVTLLAGRGHYRPRLEPRHLDAIRAVLTLTAVAAAFTISLRVFVGEADDATSEVTRLWILAATLLVASRLWIALTGRRAARTRERSCPTLIVGAGKIGQAIARRLTAHPEYGLRPVGFLDKEPMVSEGALELPVLGASWDFDSVVAEFGIRHVIVTFSTAPTDVLVRIMNTCDKLGIRASYVPRFFEKTPERCTVDRLGGLPLVSPQPANPRGRHIALKYALDRVGAAIAIVLFSPVFGALALGVLFSLGRPILYRQERVGRDGKRFPMLKFRSMRPASNDAETNVVALVGDTCPGGVEGVDRRTPFGAFLRKTSLDELPQLFNVLRGDMSFVGPRPERPEFVDAFVQTVHRYGERHRVKSGITGWAQVNGLRGKTSVADRAEWDNFYIENWSLWFDFKILLQTVMAVASPGNVE
jgi:exopolysaccharide biosynthesis polyprenyl glycosylphosphotransferase